MKSKIISLLLVGLSLCVNQAMASIYSVGYDKSNYTSDFMMGSAVVAIVFPESDGSLDPNTENWTDDRKAQAVSKIMTGHAWWTKQNPRSPLSFTYVTKTLATKYEPITRPYYNESLWIPDALGKLGYTGSKFTVCKNYVNDLRREYNTDWGFVIFVVDSLSDSDGKFSDSYFAYAYLGGPFLVMTYDNGGYGIGNMDVVAAHETGHIFNALDEYAGASSPYDYSFGYFATINGNHAWSTIANDHNSIMRGGLRWGLDDWAKKMIGWRDDNNNGVDDILDRTPDVTLSQQTLSISNGNASVQGQAVVNVLARQGNANGYGFTLDTIKKVEYSFGPNGDWKDAAAADGHFDSAAETFRIDIPDTKTQGLFPASAITVASLGIELRAVTSFSSDAVPGGSSSGGGGNTHLAAAASTLENAHAYPNPFKPNSNLNHTGITFTGLTDGAKVEIFTPGGESVYDATAPSGQSMLSWTAIDKNGANVSSGIYLFLITDPAGNKKDGKVAILR